MNFKKEAWDEVYHPLVLVAWNIVLICGLLYATNSLTMKSFLILVVIDIWYFQIKTNNRLKRWERQEQLNK